MNRLFEKDWRFWSLFAACALLAVCLTRPTLPWPRAVYRFMFVLDITQSMNARDYHLEGLPADRLGFVTAALRQALRDLPCGSEAGLGVFATQHSQILLEPVEVCARLGLLDSLVERIDWRMAWAGDSYIAQGLFSGLRALAETDPKVRLVFFSDGQQFPPQTATPPFPGKPGAVRGLIVGVGGGAPSPIPRYDQENRFLGYWQYGDLQDWLPGDEAPGLPGHESLNYPTRLDEAALKSWAIATGLGYHRLTTPAALSAALRSRELAERRVIAGDLSFALALAALILLALPYLLSPAKRNAELE